MKIPCDYRRYVPWILAGMVVVLSFVMSAMGGEESHSVSGYLTQRAVNLVRPLIDYIKEAPNWLIFNSVNYILRKIAHIIIYFLLMLFIALGVRGITDSKAIIYAVSYAAVILIAIADEFHQSFVAGRSAAVGDVAVDIAGATLVLVLSGIRRTAELILGWLRRDWPEKRRVRRQ